MKITPLTATLIALGLVGYVQIGPKLDVGEIKPHRLLVSSRVDGSVIDSRPVVTVAAHSIGEASGEGLQADVFCDPGSNDEQINCMGLIAAVRFTGEGSLRAMMPVQSIALHNGLGDITDRFAAGYFTGSINNSGDVLSPAAAISCSNLRNDGNGQFLGGKFCIYQDGDDPNRFGGFVILDKTNTGNGQGSPLCLDSNNRVCRCGHCEE